MNVGPDRFAARLSALAATVLLMIAAASCSEETPTDYTAAHREAFLAACSRPLDDPRLLSDVCGCVYDRIEDELPFDEFQRLDQRLAASPAVAAGGVTDTTAADATVPSSVSGQEDLPVEIAQLVADCFITEADL